MLSAILLARAAVCWRKGCGHQKLLREGRLHNNLSVSSFVFYNSCRHLMAYPHWTVYFLMSYQRLHSLSTAIGASFHTNAANGSAEGWRGQPPNRDM